MMKMIPQFSYVALLLMSPSLLAATLAASQEEIKGRNEYFSQTYQSACAVPMNKVAVALDRESAAQLETIFDRPLGYQFTLGDKGEAYIQLAITEWNEKFVVMTDHGVAVGMEGADITGMKITNLQCDGVTGELYHINSHEWGSYVLTVTGKPQQQVNVSIVKEQRF